MGFVFGFILGSALVALGLIVAYNLRKVEFDKVVTEIADKVTGIETKVISELEARIKELEDAIKNKI